MTISGCTLSKEIIEHWPEVFNDVELNVLPLKYLQAVLINFKDGKTWEIRITTSTKKEGWAVFEKNLSDLCRSYEHRIDNIDFKIDTPKIRKDIEQSTKKFLRKKKL